MQKGVYVGVIYVLESEENEEGKDVGKFHLHILTLLLVAFLATLLFCGLSMWIIPAWTPFGPLVNQIQRCGCKLHVSK